MVDMPDREMTATEAVEDLTPERVRDVASRRPMLNDDSQRMVRRELDIRQQRALRDQRPRRDADVDPNRLQRSLADLDPRADVSYDKEYGAALSSSTRSALRDNQKEFSNYLSKRQDEISKAQATIEPEFMKAKTALDNQKASALSSVPQARDMTQEYDKWKNTWIKLDVYDGMKNQPGHQYESIIIPKETANAYWDKVISQANVSTEGNKIFLNNIRRADRYSGDSGRRETAEEYYANLPSVPNDIRGKLLYDTAAAARAEGTNQFYQQVGPQINQFNQERSTALNSINSMYQQNFAQLQAEKAQAEGKLEGAKKSLELEVQARTEDLAQIRNSYSERLARIDQALSASVSRSATSNSEAQPVKQIDARVSTAQPQQAAAAPLPTATPTYTR